MGAADGQINTLDPSGISLAAIKALIDKNNLLVEEMKRMRKRIEELEKESNR